MFKEKLDAILHLINASSPKSTRVHENFPHPLNNLTQKHNAIKLLLLNRK